MQDQPTSRAERVLAATLLASRWLLAPIYLGLAAGLLLLLLTFGLKAAGLVSGIVGANADDVIIGMLSLIDLSLMANLVLIVVWAGYENFITPLETPDRKGPPDWIAHIGYGDLKQKLLTSIVAISAVHLLEDFMHVDAVTDRNLGWSIGLHLVFIFSVLMLAAVDRLGDRAKS